MTKKISNFDERGLLPYPVIVAANTGDPEAIGIVLRHYERQMSTLAIRKLRDERGNTLILSRLVDTFFARISLTMQPPPKPHNTACVLPWEEDRHWQSRSSGCSSS